MQRLQNAWCLGWGPLGKKKKKSGCNYVVATAAWGQTSSLQKGKTRVWFIVVLLSFHPGSHLKKKKKLLKPQTPASSVTNTWQSSNLSDEWIWSTDYPATSLLPSTPWISSPCPATSHPPHQWSQGSCSRPPAPAAACQQELCWELC